MRTFGGVHFGKPFLFIRVTDFNMAAPIEEERVTFLALPLVPGALASGLVEWLCEKAA